MRIRRFLLAGVLAAVLVAGGCSQEDPLLEGPFDVPRGFVVENVRPEGLDESLIRLTFDSFGRPVVSKENGHPTTLLDLDGDGVFESEKVFSDRVTSVQGMWFRDRTLLAIGSDAETRDAALFKLQDTDGDDVADVVERLHSFAGRMSEHGPHDIRQAPDGRLTIQRGNFTSVPADLVRDAESSFRTSLRSHLLEPIGDPRRPGRDGDPLAGGAILELDPEGPVYTRFASGFRNSYSHAYDWSGEVFLFDSDKEFEINLPWYRPVRGVHVIPGGDYGWRTGSGKLPEYALDTLPAVGDLGRGSPSGCVFYYHHGYPEEYFGALFNADWSRGRIMMLKVSRRGASYEFSDPVDFVYGEPLNVTDLEVGPDGFLYFTLGGRDTQGGLYRVAYRGSHVDTSWRKDEGVLAAARQPQPASSWGHAALAKRRLAMGAAWTPGLQEVARDAAADSYDRVQALYLLARFEGKVSGELLEGLSQDEDPWVRATVVFISGLEQGGSAAKIALAALQDSDALVRRRAAETFLRRATGSAVGRETTDALYERSHDPDRFVRYTARIALERTPRTQWAQRAVEESALLAVPEAHAALARTEYSETEIAKIQQKQVHLLHQELSPEETLRLLRAFHLTCINSEAGCPAGLRKQVSDIVLSRFPANDDRLDTEYARTLAYCGQPEALEAILHALRAASDDERLLQIHYVYCLRTMRDGWSGEQKRHLLSWFKKARSWRGGRNFTGFLGLMFHQSLEFFTAQETKLAYDAIPDFAPIKLEDARRRESLVTGALRDRTVRSISEQEILEWLMYDPMTLRAKADAGKGVYEKECMRCHRFGDLGEDYGPDLTSLSKRFSRRDIVDAVLWPSKTISDQFESYIIETTTNEIYNGLILQEDDETMLILVPQLERPLSLRKDQVKSRRASEVSTMPEQLLDGYSMPEIADLFAFLQSGSSERAAQD